VAETPVSCEIQRKCEMLNGVKYEVREKARGYGLFHVSFYQEYFTRGKNANSAHFTSKWLQKRWSFLY